MIWRPQPLPESTHSATCRFERCPVCRLLYVNGPFRGEQLCQPGLWLSQYCPNRRHSSTESTRRTHNLHREANNRRRLIRKDARAKDPLPLVLPVSPPTLVLVGVVTEANGGFALVPTPNQAGTNRIRVGDQIDGWRVAQIAPRQLFLARDDRSAAFTLFQGDGGPTVGSSA
jgi:hypothetical protein